MLVPYTNPWICLPSLKRAWDLVYTGQNHDVSEILGNLIGKSTLDWCILYQIIYTTMLLPHQSQKSFSFIAIVHSVIKISPTFFFDLTGVSTSNNRGRTVNAAVKSLLMVLTTLASVFSFGENSTRLPSNTTLILEKRKYVKNVLFVLML